MIFNGYDPALAAILAGEERSLAVQEAPREGLLIPAALVLLAVSMAVLLLLA